MIMFSSAVQRVKAPELTNHSRMWQSPVSKLTIAVVFPFRSRRYHRPVGLRHDRLGPLYRVLFQVLFL